MLQNSTCLCLRKSFDVSRPLRIWETPTRICFRVLTRWKNTRANLNRQRQQQRTASRFSRQTPLCSSEFTDEERTKASVKGNCYGCGQPIQFDFPDSAGYIPREQYLIKARHRQLNTALCHRCVALTHGEMVPGVEDFSLRDAENRPRILLTPEQLRDQLGGLRKQHTVVVMLVDLLDASGSFLGRVRNLVGKNPVMLIGTKVDLLPKGTAPEDVEGWLADTAAHKRLNVIGVKAVSSRTGQGVPAAVAAIRKERKGRDVYVIGAANVGKSAFVRALLKDMGSMSSMQFDPAAMQIARRAPTESAMPGTTLSKIPLRCFASGGSLYDTPGLHIHHRLPHLLTPDELKEIHPRRRLTAYLAPPVETAPGASEGSATYLWGGLVRIDVVDAGTQLAFYGPPVMKAYALPLLGPEDEIDVCDGSDDEPAGREGAPGVADEGADYEEMEGGDEPLFGVASTKRRGGLRLARTLELKTTGRIEAVCDLAVSGLAGWVSVVGTNRRSRSIAIRVFVPPGVEVFMRPPMPVPNPIAQQRRRKKPLARPSY
uniref:Nitric-oxide synthase, plant n=1 Tax=Tetraselmis sp. GSL018 TaxID=582737 RepID=A0A061RY59_9CHLO